MVRVLVVDDERLVRGLLVKRLELAGFAVAEAGGGTQALELISRERFDVVVLDLLMPGTSGFDVLSDLRRKRQDQVPVVVLTNNELIEHRQRCEELGVSSFLVKSDEALKKLPEAVQTAARDRNH